MNRSSIKSTFAMVAAYILIAAVIGFFAIQVEVLKSWLGAHRAYIIARDVRWEKVITRILDHIDREEALESKIRRSPRDD